jgi:septal ring factor EnvC (AmiA/AmiB activator)
MNKPAVVILALALVLASVAQARHAAAEEAAGSKKELQRIKREMREKQKNIKRADKRAHSILAELDRIDRDIQAGKTELAEQQKQLQNAETSLRGIEENNARVSRDLAGLKRAYAERLRALYKLSRSGSVAPVLVSQGLDSASRRIKYLDIITERDRAIMREYGSALNALAAQQTEISEQKKTVLEHERTVEVREAELEARKRKKAALLASVREEKGLYEQTLHELEESSASLWAMIRKAEQEREAAREARPAPSTPPKAAREAISGTGRLPWPVEGRVLTRFGMQRHPQFKTMVFRRGIEIAAREGEPVRAVADGQVAYADWYKGYGNLLIIEHGPGFYTLYGNLSKLDQQKGDRVVRGQEIGLAGDTGSLKGSKLYFEVRRNGEAQDPLTWLAKK